MNQCDGCKAGIPINKESGLHDGGTYGTTFGCDADRYPQTGQAEESSLSDLLCAVQNASETWDKGDIRVELFGDGSGRISSRMMGSIEFDTVAECFKKLSA